MALPNQFANATTATGLQLDQNFAALGALTPIPCVVAGANTITLTPNASTPTVAAYSNYMQFTGIAAQSNTGPATGKVGSLPTVQIFKPGTAGPVALTGGEIVAGVAIQLLYDSTLNSGSGGFHLLSPNSILQTITASVASITTGYITELNTSLASITLAYIATLNTSLASITRLSVGSGPTITHILSTLSSITWPSLVPSTTAESIIALGGCSVGDNVMIGYPASVHSNITYRGYVPNAGSIAIVAQNFAAAATITPTPGNYRVTAQGFV